MKKWMLSALTIVSCLTSCSNPVDKSAGMALGNRSGNNNPQNIKYFTATKGAWNSAIWVTGILSEIAPKLPLPCEKMGSDSLFLFHDIYAGTCNPLILRGSNVLVLKAGKTYTTNDLTINGSFKIIIEEGAMMTVNGRLNMLGTSEIFIEGVLQVNGNVDMTGNSRVCGSGIASRTGTLKLEGNAEWCLALPIELSKFEGKWSGHKVSLNWETSSETNNDFFTVERSIDAEEFVSIGKVKGNGTSNLLMSYKFVDETPDRSANWIYYRLKQTDTDETYTYSYVIAIDSKQGDGVDGIKVFPNPANAQFKVQLGNLQSNVDIFVYNSLGQIVSSNNNINEQQVTIDCKDWPAGVYSVAAVSGNLRQVQQLVVRK